MSSATIEALLVRYAPNIPPAAAATDLRCCCGNAECTFLLHSNSALEVLEKDVRSAARIGQALLVRHEAYITDAEQERSRQDASISALEVNRDELETKNAKLADENKALLQHVESLNSALANSDAQLKSITASYHSSQQEIQKLNALASRTEELEVQLSRLEAEQSQLQSTLATTEEERRVVTGRWSECQRTVVRLQEQMESIEREADEEKQRHIDFVDRMRKTRAMEKEHLRMLEVEATEERERHDEVVERMKKTRIVEKELENAAGRLKNAAAGNDKSNNYRTSSVVSNFVKEILEDNARLQLHMVELQEMITRSTEEIEMLRQQAYLPDHSGKEFEGASQRRSLSIELGTEYPQHNVSYEQHPDRRFDLLDHSTPSSAKGKGSTAQRPRKRPSINSGKSTPMIISHTRSSSAAITLSDAASPESNPPRRINRWSGTSHQTRSSITSSTGGSPPSSYCTSTIFELPQDGEPIEFSRPTSPESNVWSPPLKPSQEDTPRDTSFEELPPLCEDESSTTENLPTPIKEVAQLNFPQALISKSNSTTSTVLQAGISNDATSPFDKGSSETPITITRPTNTNEVEQFPRRPTFLRRTNSTDSLMSISGMDIHTSAPPLRKRPSHLSAVRTSDLQNSGPILTAASASAVRSPLSSAGLDSEGVLRSTMGNEGRGFYTPLQDTFGKKLGGWFSGRWGGRVANRPAHAADVRARAVSDDVSSRSAILADRRLNRESEVINESILLHAGSGKDPPALKRVKTGRVLVAHLDEDSLKECLEIEEGD